ncbi:MAG: RNA polymerase sigma factor [Saprospiraceae bacterium]|nr:RNA polymerase sigma factor [Bacteroidia bacterium]NNK90437.1 RNA polymerase sigma factor [Saprospiraceae bacterium]
MTEKEIIRLCKKRNARGQRAFVDQYSDLIYSICMRYVGSRSFADDCLQESLIHILNNIDKYEDRGKFNSWLSSVTVRKCLDWIKKEKRKASVQLDHVAEPFSDEIISMKLEKEEVLKFMELIPDNYRIVINMFLVEGYSHKEIAKYLGITESTSRSLLSRGRKIIREVFENEKMLVVYKNSGSKKKIVSKH